MCQQSCVQDSGHPVVFTATKSRLGHGETGAGVMGLLSAVTQINMQTCSPLTHLRAVNSHVASILSSHKGRLQAQLPRQHMLACPEASTHIGISAFAFQVRLQCGSCSHKRMRSKTSTLGCHAIGYKKELLHVPLQVSHRDSNQEFYVACFTLTTRLQGTNAHAILAPPELASQPDKQIASPAWRRKRYWHLPSAHSVMVSLISAAESRIQLAGSLRTPALTFLLDHQVTNCSLSMVDHRLDAYCGDGIDAAVAAFKQVQ